MTDELREHLIRCEKAIQSLKPILGQHGFPADNRNLTVIGFISWLIEHHEAILLLTMHDMPGSASALLRPVVEGSYRALWINLPATDDQVKTFNDKDRIDLTVAGIASAIDAAYDMTGFFQELKERTWKHLNSYTHGGMLQIGRRFRNDEVANNYTDGETSELVTTATTVILLTVSLFLKRNGHTDSGETIQGFLETYGPLAAKSDAQM